MNRLSLTAYKIIGIMIKEDIYTLKELKIRAGGYNVAIDGQYYRQALGGLENVNLITLEGKNYVLTKEIIVLWVKTQRYYERLARFEFDKED